MLDPQKTKKGRRYFPGAVRNFVEGTNLAADKIHVLLTNMHLLTNAKLLKEAYDSEAIGCYRPFDALKKTRPIVIIDEPHRFSKGQQAFQTIEKELSPPCIIRYGATFPDVTRGKGRNRATVKDYNNLLYNLDACDSFNQNLIKGIAKEHFEPPTKQEEKVKYLYDAIAYDSPLEKENIATSGNIDEVVVYGKIPRSSIAIPTIMGGTYSPDFMYVVRRGDGVKELNVVVETKSVENKSQLREEEQAKIDCARKFFEQMKIDGYRVAFRTQINNKKMKQIIEDVLAAGA